MKGKNKQIKTNYTESNSWLQSSPPLAVVAFATRHPKRVLPSSHALPLSDPRQLLDVLVAVVFSCDS